MNDPASPVEDTQALDPADRASALFANLVLQQTNMALMFLGKIAHPQSGRESVDLESAQLIIDQLEMLQTKTKGNLDPREDHLLQQSLMSLRLAFVEAVNAQPAPAAPATAGPAPAPASGPTPATASPAPEASQAEESRVKFSKKY